jgi:hypothetical protein
MKLAAHLLHELHMLLLRLLQLLLVRLLLLLLLLPPVLLGRCRCCCVRDFSGCYCCFMLPLRCCLSGCVISHQLQTRVTAHTSSMATSSSL